MTDKLTKFYNAVSKFAKENGKFYISVRIGRTTDYSSKQPAADIYEGYVDGYHWESGGSIQEVITMLKSHNPPPPDAPTEKSASDDEDLPF